VVIGQHRQDSPKLTVSVLQSRKNACFDDEGTALGNNIADFVQQDAQARSSADM